MSSDERAVDLQEAILNRGRSLAAEHLRQAEAGRDRILADCADKLRLLEEKEMLSAKASGEREYRRLVQAGELRMQATEDQLRWALVQSAIDALRGRFAEIVEDEARYAPLLEGLLARAAAAIESDDLRAALNERDGRRFADRWTAIAKQAAPGKRVTLVDEPHGCTGGILVTSADDRIRVDNTFAGRIERYEQLLYRTALERLIPSTMQMRIRSHG